LDSSSSNNGEEFFYAMGEKGMEEKVFMVFCESLAIHNSMTSFFNVNYVASAK
jgi:hypothetical protein